MSALTSLGFSIGLLHSKACRLTIALRPDVGGERHWMDAVGADVVRLVGTPPN